MSFIHDHDHTHDHRCEIDNHGDREVAVVLASMSVSPPTGGVFGPSITGPIDHEGEPEVDMDDVEDGDDETEDSAEPTPLGAQYPGDFQAARKTTRGRKLAAVTRESIADLTADEQKMVLGYTRKYQQKAAAILRALKLSNSHRLTNKTVLKPCETCASQDWPCVLTVENNFGIRKQVSRCYGCRHTRSTCSLKEAVKGWDEADGRMPWTTTENTPFMPSRPFPASVNDVRFSVSPAMPPTHLPTSFVLSNPPAPFTIADLPQNVNRDIAYFLHSISPSAYKLGHAVATAIVALAESVGGHVVPLGGSHFATPSPIQLKTPHSLPPTEHYKYGALSRYDDHDYEMPAPALTQDRRFSEQRRSITDSPYLSTPKLAPMGEPAGSPPHFAHLPGVSGIDSLELEGVGHAHVPSIVIDNGPSKFRPRDPLAYRQTSRSARRAASPYSTDHSRSYSMSMSRYAGRSQTLEPPQTLLPRSDFLPLAPPQTHRAGSVPPVAIPRLSSSSYPSKMAPSWDPTLSRAVSEAPMERSRPRWRTE